MFSAALREGREPIVTAVDGHVTLAVIETAMRSAREKKWLDIAY